MDLNHKKTLRRSFGVKFKLIGTIQTPFKELEIHRYVRANIPATDIKEGVRIGLLENRI